MIETHEFRIKTKYVSLLLMEDEGKNNGTNRSIVITKDDPKFEKIKYLSKVVREKYNDSFFLFSRIKREYSKRELDKASLFHIKIKSTFEPAGEECGTIYDETTACQICGANRQQVSALRLNKTSVPKKDISRTIAGEIVVSEKFANSLNNSGLKGSIIKPVYFADTVSNFYQLLASSQIQLSENTIAGNNVFESSEMSLGRSFKVSEYDVEFQEEVYKCPLGHTIGLNLISEAFVLKEPSLRNYDFFESKQRIGVKRGLLRPEPVYLCSPAFRDFILKEKFTGFGFEVAYLENK